MKRVLAIVLLGLVFAPSLPSIATGPAQEPVVTPLATQFRNEVEISLLKIERTSKWKNPLGMGDEYQAKEGHEWVVFHLHLKSARSEVSYKILEAVDDSDQHIKSLTKELTAFSFSGKPIDQEFEIPFLVVNGARITSLRIGDFQFELKLRAK